MSIVLIQLFEKISEPYLCIITTVVTLLIRSINSIVIHFSYE